MGPVVTLKLPILTLGSNDRHGQPRSRQGVYQCPKCGYEDESLAKWRRMKTHHEKWDQATMKWYKRMKCQHQWKAEGKSRQEIFGKLVFNLNFGKKCCKTTLQKLP